MAQTYSFIQQTTVGSGGTSAIEFSNIPQNYTELIIKTSLRAVQSNGFLRIRFNDDSSNIYTYRWLYGNGSNGATTAGTDTAINWIDATNSGDTASTFNNGRIIIPNYSNTSYQKTISADVVRETNAISATLGIVVGLWPSTSAINKISIFVTSGNLAQYSTATLYGVGGARATGGTITSDLNYTYHTFTSSNTFTALEKINNAEVLLVAGGGGGASGASGPGGGAGGVIVYSGQTLTAGTSYTSLVGAGGTAGTSGVGRIDGLSGNNSSFANNSAIGGGKGGEQTAAGNGGSGGGGGLDFAAGTGTSGQGFNGARSDVGKYGGGGGGAGGLGLVSDGGGAVGGPGTNAYNYWHTATSTGVLSGGTYFIGGGGGAGANIQFQSGTPSIGGIGGGGSANSTSTAGSGTANTGGGGGGGSYQSSTYGAGGAGGSGLVIVRYPNI